MSDTIKLVAEAIAETNARIVKNPAIYSRDLKSNRLFILNSS